MPEVATPLSPRTQRSAKGASYQHLYKTKRWQTLRWAVLTRDYFTCQMCHRMETDISRLVADHIDQHKGDPSIFYDETRIRCLCKPCHDRFKQSEERTGRKAVTIGTDGWPVEN